VIEIPQWTIALLVAVLAYAIGRRAGRTERDTAKRDERDDGR
jgi:hypothetical protein